MVPRHNRHNIVFFSLALAAALVSVLAAAPSATADNMDLGFVDTIHRLDKDQRDMEELLRLGAANRRGFGKAYDLYQRGGYAAPTAILELEAPLDFPLEPSQAVEGPALYGEGGESTVLHPRKHHGVNSIELELVYQEGCLVGGLPPGWQDAQGCLAPRGTLWVTKINPNGTTESHGLGYRGYDYTNNTETLWSLQKLGWMEDWFGRLPIYDTFRKYYGYLRYADEFVKAAFLGQRISNADFDIDFNDNDLGARAEAIRTATVALSVWMRVHWMMELALQECQDQMNSADSQDETERESYNHQQEQIAEANADALAYWKTAFGLYVGSNLLVVGSDGILDIEATIKALREDAAKKHDRNNNNKNDRAGWFVYGIADEQSRRFRTYNNNNNNNETNTTNNNNPLDDITHHQQLLDFAMGADLLEGGYCRAAKQTRNGIARRLIIPLIRGTLWHAYHSSSSVVGSVYAASILPLVHECDADAAETLQRAMQRQNFYGWSSHRFEKARKALASTYACLGISPGEVGLFWDAERGVAYYPDDTKTTKHAPVLVLAGVLGGLVLGTVASGLDRRQRCEAADAAVDAAVAPLIAAADDDTTLATEDSGEAAAATVL